MPIVSPTRGELRVRLTRAHLEEDAGKSLHEDFQGMTGIDLNRAGTPLLEIVSEPDLRSADEAVAYAKALHGLVRWIGICDGNMQEGSFRCDANVSVRRAGETRLGTRCEIKNLNSFRFLERAIEYEVRRQVELIEDGGTVVQETRLYDPDRDETRSMRSKEDAQDYRYFPGSGPAAARDRACVDRAGAGRAAGAAGGDEGPLRDAVRVAGARGDDAHGEPRAGRVFRGGCATLRRRCEARRELDRRRSVGRVAPRATSTSPRRPCAPPRLPALLRRIADGTISSKIAKDVFDAMWAGEGDPDAIIASKGLKQITDEGAIEKLVDEVIATNPAIVAEFRAGKDKAFNALVGKAMAATKGKANPAQVNADAEAQSWNLEADRHARRGDGRAGRHARAGSLRSTRSPPAAGRAGAAGATSRATCSATSSSDPPVERGRVSLYSHEFAGRPTASGERFDPEALTMAHRTLPFGTRVRVTNLENRQSVEVVVNDRGPFIRGRIADLSLAAARRIGMITDGVVDAVLEIVAPAKAR